MLCSFKGTTSVLPTTLGMMLSMKCPLIPMLLPLEGGIFKYMHTLQTETQEETHEQNSKAVLAFIHKGFAHHLTNSQSTEYLTKLETLTDSPNTICILTLNPYLAVSSSPRSLCHIFVPVFTIFLA